VPLVQKSNAADTVVCINFNCWMLQSLHDSIVDSAHLFISDETWSCDGFVNAQNSCHGDIKNLHTIYEVPLHDQIVGVWCAVSGWRVIDPIFFYDVNLECNVKIILELFLKMLTEEGNNMYISSRITQQPRHDNIWGGVCEIFGERFN
jgi:hypothetical protein